MRAYIRTYIGAPQYIKQILTDLKGEINSNTVRLADFNTSLRSVDTISRKQASKETLPLCNTLSHVDLLYMYLSYMHSCSVVSDAF